MNKQQQNHRQPKQLGGGRGGGLKTILKAPYLALDFAVVKIQNEGSLSCRDRTDILALCCPTVSLPLSHWYPGSGVVLDCIDSWSLHPHSLSYRMPVTVFMSLVVLSRVVTGFYFSGDNPLLPEQRCGVCGIEYGTLFCDFAKWCAPLNTSCLNQWN